MLAACSNDGRELRPPEFPPPAPSTTVVVTTTTMSPNVLPSLITLPPTGVQPTGVQPTGN